MISRFLRALWIAGAAIATPIVETPRVSGMAQPDTAVEVAAPDIKRV